MKFVPNNAVVAELERKLKDCEERVKTCGEAETIELKEECQKYRELISLARSNKVLW